ncbi:MAG: ribosomal protein S18-alanine N-acetyltransferase [Chloroflexota bacterium]|nr:ribosomal protein S18-alanine N-acetyltransferase [Chloroflexota bacterium]MDE2894637.1 ribosomal protein S18-alanine N-acetyltransferase [Chloroflexota bacterium]
MTQQLLLRPMTLDDLDDVTGLDGRAFGASGWSRRYFEGELTDSPISIFYVLADPQRRLLGYFGTWHVVDQLHLCTFAVDPDQQGQGLGALLLNCVIRLAQRLECQLIQLEVRESNAVARSLYRSRGFHDDAIRPNLYSNPREDGVLMGMPTPQQLDDSSWRRAGDRRTGGLLLHWDDRGGQTEERWPVG